MLQDVIHVEKKWTIRKFNGDRDVYERWLAGSPDASDQPFEVVEFEGNLLLNEGIAEMWDLIIASGTPTAFSNANAYLGVGDSATAAAATDTGLIATTNELYKAMESGYPSRASQTVTWRSVFGSTDANFAWNEFTVANGNSDAADNMNRKVSAQGTKTAGQTWTLDLAITLS